jgi:hypothetical protein
MTNEEMNGMVQSIYDRIFDSVTKAEPGGKPLMQTSTTLLSLCKPGMAINPKDYKNPWTPGNINGSQLSALNTAMLADVAPKVNAIYTDSGNQISQTYGQIMNGVNVKAQTPNPTDDAQLKTANDVLYRKVNIADPDTGEVTVKVLESQLYRDYQDNQTAYMTARAAYMGAYFEAQKTQTGKSTWPLLAPTLQLPVKSAYDKWRSNFADKVEQAIAIMNTTSANALSKAFDQAKKLFEGYGVELDETGTGGGPLTYRSYLLPSDWYSPNSSSKWTGIDISSGSTLSNTTSDYKSYGGSAGFNLGLWSVGGNAGHSSQNQHMSNETSGLRISFEYTIVNIRRPWMTFNLLGIPGWNLSNLYSKGKISNGSKLGQDDSIMPVLPTAFVVVKNIIISANWAKSDWDLAKSQTSGGGSIGWGPFKIGGSYSSYSSKETFTSSFADGKITVPGVQIIGWIGQIVPFCPPAP